MTEQEKNLGLFLAEIINGTPDSGDNFKDCFTLAKALIQRYPQILAEKVWEGDGFGVDFYTELDGVIKVPNIGQIIKYCSKECRSHRHAPSKFKKA